MATSTWAAQNITIDAIGTITLTPYEMVLYDGIINGDRALIVDMLDHGADPDLLIPLASHRGSTEIIERCIEIGASVAGFQAHLLKIGHPELLCGAPHDILIRGLRSATQDGAIPSIRRLLAQLNRDEDAIIKDLALGVAVRNGNFRAAHEIIKRGHLSPDCGLHYAAQFNNPKAARYMLKEGANLDAVITVESDRGCTNMVMFLQSLRSE